MFTFAYKSKVLCEKKEKLFYPGCFWFFSIFFLYIIYFTLILLTIDIRFFSCVNVLKNNYFCDDYIYLDK